MPVATSWSALIVLLLAATGNRDFHRFDPPSMANRARALPECSAEIQALKKLAAREALRLARYSGA